MRRPFITGWPPDVKTYVDAIQVLGWSDVIDGCQVRTTIKDRNIFSHSNKSYLFQQGITAANRYHDNFCCVSEDNIPITFELIQNDISVYRSDILKYTELKCSLYYFDCITQWIRNTILVFNATTSKFEFSKCGLTLTNYTIRTHPQL